MPDLLDQTLDFAPNYTHIIELDVTPWGPKPTWRYALRGITECTPENDETVNTDVYYHNLGQTESEVESVSISLALTGHRMYGDPVQDYVQSLATKAGKDRKTNFRWTHPDGTLYEGGCTLTELIPGSGMGEANAKGEFTYRINLNTFTEQHPDLTGTPDSITADDVTVDVEGTATVNAQVLPAKANQKCHYGIADTTVATVDQDGVITGVEDGETLLTIKAASKPTVIKQVTVTVGEGKKSKAVVTAKTEGSYLGVNYADLGTFQIEGRNITGQAKQATAQGWNGEGQDKTGYFIGLRIDNCKQIKTAKHPEGKNSDETGDWLILLGEESPTLSYIDVVDTEDVTKRYTVSVTAES